MSGNIMNAAVMGMNAQTSWLASISQNIANSSTTGYKDAETQFTSLVDQSGAGNYSAGGVATNTVSMNSLQGSVVGTATTTDLAVQGNGFFVVSDSAGDTFLTRDGSFVPDSSGNLVNAAGYYLMGYSTAAGAASPSANSTTGLVKVNVDQNSPPLPTATTSGVFSANLPSTAAVVPTASAPAAGGTTYTEKTSLVTYDDLGAPVTLDVYMTNLGNNAAGDPQWEVDVYNSADAAAGGGLPYTPATPMATSTLVFSPTTGTLTGGSNLTNGDLSIAIPNGQTMSLDMSGMTQVASAYAVSTATTNGNAPETPTGLSISANGTLSYTYASGATTAAYDIPLANVASPDSLTSVNGTVFSTNVNSGQIQVGTAGTAGFGSIESSSLESSTVDLATELTAMIQAQSSYEANSKVFQTGANLLDILNKIQA
ncbi:flagellar hook protein FlgE [Methylocapsa sp. S129]|uniref:flagellar hook protein FlgE n=1 Tax=Methylocapsa sp. S129 TaxID=1641869 RepID=UPI00131CBE12|nr:flagellar hook protein FlgE [Methylocapsa sp. S129]